MGFMPIEQRENTGAYTLPTKVEDRQIFINQLLQPFRFVMLMGLSCTGKSSFLDAYEGRDGWSLTRWNRDTILDMVFQDGVRVDKHYQYLNRFESDLFPDLFVRERHQVIVEGWNRLPSTRMRYLNMFPQPMGACAILVFDGPISEIIHRNKVANKLNLSETELPIYLEEKHSTIVWPKFEEGWDGIYYINTFEGMGARYLQERLL